MEFTVQFVGTKDNYALSISNSATGIDGVDAIRSTDLNSEFPLAEINPQTDGTKQDPSIILSEAQARQTCQFLVDNLITVEVPEGYLNKYAFRKVIINKSFMGGKTYNVSIVWQVNEIELIKDWLDIGAPLFWNGDLYILEC